MTTPISPARRRRWAIRFVIAAFTLLGMLCFAVPLLLLISGSFRSNAEAFRYAGELSLHSLIPKDPTLDGYQRLAQRPLFLLQIWNTVLAGVVLATATTIVAVLAAFPLARHRFKGRSALFMIMLATWFIPLDVVMPPLFFVARRLALLDSFWGLVLPFVFSPMAIYLLRQAILEVPVELDQAAALDGAGPFGILRTAILPNIRAPLLAVWLMHFVFIWGWFLWPIIIMQRDDGQLAQVAIAGLLDPLGGNDYSLVFAGAVATVVPAFIIFTLLQRFLVESAASSGGK